MSWLISRARAQDRGAAMVLVAMSIVLLMGMAAFGSDLAWYYLNASRVQRAADAAALGGVVWLPGNTGTANSTAISIADQNGYDDATPEVQVTSGAVSGEPNQLEVSVQDTVPTFFLKIFGFDEMEIERSAIAEYIPPLKLGSPTNQFGNSCAPGAGCTGQPNFWANIHGKWTDTTYGDAYASYCVGSSDNPNCTQNPIARPGGYLFGIEKGSGSFTVQGLDLRFFNISGGQTTSDSIRTGDRGCEDWTSSTSASCGPTMRVRLYAPDPTPLDLSDNGAPLCSTTIAPAAQVAPTSTYTWATPNGSSCWTQSGSGIYVLQISHVDPGSTPTTNQNLSGLNRYSVRANGTGAKLFALGDFSIYNNANGTTTAFHLAEVPTYYHGKTFVIELYDAGESADPGTLAVVDPSGSTFDDGQCRIYSRNNPSVAWNLQQTIPAGSACQETVAPSEYQGRWLKFEMDLPPNYTCTTCWWKMNYVYTSSVNDTTTWRAYMIGNPIHLID
ncbi:MAG TPA: TadE/TadG family type IV pilus assembly protein [Acidimicrobiia bacterium]|nr:TadE/TadG family type IV pilus assembly protein [Acidimicrobiia bacterium]